MRHLREAGIAAYHRGGCREAATCFTQAVAAHGHLPRNEAWVRAAIELRFALRHALVPIVERKDLGRLLQECERFASEPNDRPRLARAWAFLGHLQWWFGEHEHAVDLCRRALGVPREIGDESLQVSTDMYHGHCTSLGPDETWPLADWYAGIAYVRSGRVDEGLAWLEPIRQPSYSVTGGVGRSMLGAWLAEGYLLSGRRDEALALAEPAVRLAHEHKERGYEAAALRVLGDIAAAAEPAAVATAEQRYLQGRAIAEELGMRPLAARCRVGLGLLSRGARRRLPARRELAAAAEACRTLGMKADLDRAEAALAGV